VIRTRVGYTGGTKQNPDYYHLGDHTESIQIDFDPAQVSYEELLRQFFAAHSPTHRPYSIQYRSAVFYADEAQRETAERVIAELEQAQGARIFTAVEPASRFYLAEDYHQKYYLKHDSAFVRELDRLFKGDEAALIHSTAAARLSGLTGGYAAQSLSADKLSELGLSEAGIAHAKELLSGSVRPQIMCK
jgi:peptide-methionine (S)-S-oxide reductase